LAVGIILITLALNLTFLTLSLDFKIQKMRKYIKIWSLVSVTAMVILVGCKRGDDLYISPNSPAEVTPGLLLTAIEVSTFNSYEGNLVKNASILVQQNAGVDGQAIPINNYNLPENEFDNQWKQLYQALFNCKDLQTRYGAANPYYSGVTDVLSAMNWGLLTDLWGDIPFSEALQGQINYQAKYDSQEQVIKGILTLLDGAIAKLQLPAANNTFLPGNDDLAFKGDVSKWIKVAYSLKARYQNRLSKTSLYNAADVLESLSKGISSSSEDFITIHGPNPNEANQWYDFQNNRANYILASLPFVDSIKLRPTDLRLYSYFDSTSLGGVIGTPIDNATADASPWGTYLAGSSSVGIRILSFTEMKFIEAEVKARKGDATAFQALNDAIKESCITVTNGVYNGNDIANYTAANTNVSRIIYEKWIALFGSAEPYNDYRKTGFPVLSVNPNGLLSVIPKRFPTPQAERVSNPNAPVPALTTPVWFAQ
jgi:hypothetical protein